MCKLRNRSELTKKNSNNRLDSTAKLVHILWIKCLFYNKKQNKRKKNVSLFCLPSNFLPINFFFFFYNFFTLLHLHLLTLNCLFYIIFIFLFTFSFVDFLLRIKLFFPFLAKMFIFFRHCCYCNFCV